MLQQPEPRNVHAPKESADWLRALEYTTRAVEQPHRTLARVLDDLAREHGERIAVIGEDTTLSFAGLASLTHRYARWALQNGVSKGDCVALLMPNHPHYLAIWAGVSQVGGVVALLNTNLQGAGLAHCLRIVSPKHVIVAQASVSKYEAALIDHPLEARFWIHGAGHPAADRIDDAIALLPDAPLGEREAPPVTLSDLSLIHI